MFIRVDVCNFEQIRPLLSISNVAVTIVRKISLDIPQLYVNCSLSLYSGYLKGNSESVLFTTYTLPFFITSPYWLTKILVYSLSLSSF